ncbi:MAG: aminotransferase class V-fold PLP-dependent enzyme [Solirubrobacteraceae bacterium]
MRRLALPDRLQAAQREFDTELSYLNTATLGLPPRRAWTALQSALTEWQAGTVNPVEYDVPLAAARTAYARLVNVEPGSVAVGSQVSVFAGLVAAALPRGSEVLVAAGDFTSILFPFHVQAGRGVTVREAALERIADEVTSRTTLVAVSAVQSADGRLADLDALHDACASSGTRVLLDTTQAAGWLPIDAGRFAYTVCGGYKWLLAPRGTAYLTVATGLLDELIPHNAGWYAGQNPWESIYGYPLRLASDARRFDVSPAWHSWVGAAPALELLSGVGIPALHANAVGLANQFRAGVGLPHGDSAIVSALADGQAPELMARAGVVGSVRAGRLRLSFHVSTSAEDVARAVEALSGHLRP